MSEDFLKLARKEIGEELEGLQKILTYCRNDNDIYKNSTNMEKHLHKIKGLAPMMGQVDIGEIAKLDDVVLKYVIANGSLDQSFTILNESYHIMKEIFYGHKNTEIEQFKNKIRNTFDKVFR